MADCRFCKLPVGWFKKEHAECAMQAAEQRRYEEALRAAATQQLAAERIAREQAAGAIAELVASSFLDVVKGKASVDVVETVVSAAAVAGILDATEMRQTQVSAWEAAARECLRDDEELSPEDDRGLAVLQVRFGLTQSELNVHGVLTEVAKRKVFTALARGLPPNALTLEPSHPVMLKKGELAVWQFNPATLFQDQIAGRVQEDVGLLLVTTRNLYFVGQGKSFQLPLMKIAAVVPFTDGVSVGRLAVTTKPLIFRTGDGPFAHKLVTTLVRLVNK